MKRTTKLVSVLLAVLIALSSFSILPISAFDHSSKAPGSSYEFGDVNRDGVIDIIDATLVQKYSVDKATLDNEQKILGDVNGDGEVDILDATLVQKFVVDRISKFPVEDKVPTEPTTIEEPTEAPEGDYYILGTMNGWSVSDDYKLTANEAADGEFVFTGLKLKTTDKFKVAYSVAGAEPRMWFPNGYNDNYGQHGEITADGTYDLYFRPDGQGGEDWFKGVIYLEAKEAPTAEPDTTVAPEPTEPGTAAPAGTITVKFTDALGWGDVHVYYWNNGAEWPGTAMEKAEVNDFGQQVYTAEIPADVEEIIFNGNGNQTVDIKTDIADGAQWYTVDEKEGNNYQVTLVGEETQPTEDPTPDPEPTGTTVKLQPNNWANDGARFAIYVFNDSTGTNAWADMTAVGDGTYTVTIPEGTWDKVIFVRMNPSATANNWNNKWNQSANLDITDGKLYTVPSNSWDYWTA